MLVQLLVQDIVLIDNLDIEFDRGLCVLSGETGAGKSILLDALSIALGARGDGDLVRVGADKGQVHAVFTLPHDHDVVQLLRDDELLSHPNGNEDDGDVEIILRRVQSGDGRTRAFVNDIPVSATKLREIGRQLVEIHGQHDERALVDGGKHRSLLDAFGGHEKLCLKTANAWQSWARARKDIAQLEAQIKEAGREAEYLRSSVAELEKLSPQAGEEAELATMRQTMMQAQTVAGDLQEANEVLAGQGAAAPILASLARKLERKSQNSPGLLEDVIEHLDGAINSLYEAQQALDNAIYKSEFDPRALDNAEERLFALRAAARKYNVSVENLPMLASEMARKLDSLDHGEARLEEMQKQCEQLEADYFEFADELSRKRKNAGEKLSRKVGEELPSLKLEQAQFIVAHESDRDIAGENGYDKIEFWVRTNPGTKPGPMFKTASGGELSRFLLALKVVLAEKGSAPTLVFDEIDTGVGGAVADAIGRRLERLSERVQVLSVTHAPQVAARAGRHFLISKSSSGLESGKVSTGVASIEGDSRLDEIARMLSGASITQEARAAAQRLLDPIA